MKIAIYVSNNATTIQKILKVMEENFYELLNNIEFILIDNINNKRLREKTESLKIKLYEINIENMKNKNERISEKLLELSQNNDIDYIFLFCDKILKGDLLKEYKNKIINFHPSLLPSFKGLMSIDKALNSDVILLGNTAHFINEKLDEGIIIMQSIYPRYKFKGYDDILNLQIIMFVQLVEWLISKRIFIEDKKCKILDSIYEIDTFIPRLENKRLIEIYNKNYKMEV